MLGCDHLCLGDNVAQECQMNIGAPQLDSTAANCSQFRRDVDGAHTSQESPQWDFTAAKCYQGRLLASYTLDSPDKTLRRLASEYQKTTQLL